MTGGRSRAVPVAVRSSAEAEDLPGASFAGQYDTALNVDTPDGLPAAVRRCWASGWSDRAVAYRRQAGLDPAFAAPSIPRRARALRQGKPAGPPPRCEASGRASAPGG